MSFESLLIDQGQAPDIIDESTAPATTYLGWCLPGTVATNQAKYKLKRISNAAGITKTEWANGDQLYDNIWDDRAIIPYSFLK